MAEHQWRVMKFAPFSTSASTIVQYRRNFRLTNQLLQLQWRVITFTPFFASLNARTTDQHKRLPITSKTAIMWLQISSSILDVYKQNTRPQTYTENKKIYQTAVSVTFKNWIVRVKGRSRCRYNWWTLLDALSSYQALVINEGRCQWIQGLSTTPRRIRVQL